MSWTVSISTSTCVYNSIQNRTEHPEVQDFPLDTLEKKLGNLRGDLIS